MCSSGNGNNHAIEYIKYWHKLSSFGEKIFDAQFSLLQRNFKIAVLFRTDMMRSSELTAEEIAKHLSEGQKVYFLDVVNVCQRLPCSYTRRSL